VQDAERLPYFVADEPRKSAHLLGLLFNGLRVARDEGVDRLLLQPAHRRRQEPERAQSIGGGDRRLGDRHFVLEELVQDLAEDLVLAQQLMNGCLLFVAQLAQLGGLRHDGCIGRDAALRRRLEMAGNLVDQIRDVIQQLVRWKHVAAVDREQRLEALQPLPRDSRVGLMEPKGEVLVRRTRRLTGAHERASIEMPTLSHCQSSGKRPTGGVPLKVGNPVLTSGAPRALLVPRQCLAADAGWNGLCSKNTQGVPGATDDGRTVAGSRSVDIGCGRRGRDGRTLVEVAIARPAGEPAIVRRAIGGSRGAIAGS